MTSTGTARVLPRIARITSRGARQSSHASGVASIVTTTWSPSSNAASAYPSAANVACMSFSPCSLNILLVSLRRGHRRPYGFDRQRAVRPLAEHAKDHRDRRVARAGDDDRDVLARGEVRRERVGGSALGLAGR